MTEMRRSSCSFVSLRAIFSNGLSPSSRLVALVALLSVTIVRLPLLFGDGAVARFACLLPFVLCIIWADPTSRHDGHRRPESRVVALWAFAILAAIAVYRTYSSWSLVATILVTTHFSFRLMTSARNDAERWSRVVAILLAPSAFVTFNIVIQLVSIPGINVPAPDLGLSANSPAEILGLAQISAQRTALPLASGVNGTGIIGATGLAAAVILARRSPTPSRWVTIPAGILSLYATLIADSRSAFVIAIGCVGLVMLLPRARGLGGFSGLALISPAVIAILAALLSSSGASFLARSGGDIATGESRTYIWGEVITFLRAESVQDKLIGWGANGQVASGASRQYAYLFPGRNDATSFSAHNLELQYLLDGGLVLLLAFVTLVFLSIRATEALAARDEGAPGLALRAVLLVLLFNGFTESLPSYLFLDSFTLFLIACGAALGCLPQPLRVPDPLTKRSTPGTPVPSSTA
ncbi:MAG: O-antigen ligase family protein [Solirubrobacteraceae bacterium]